MEQEIIRLLDITKSLRGKYSRSFTLDGRLVGDIGEALAKEFYNIELLPENTPQYDAIEIDTNRKIQIKTTMKKYFTFPFDHIPDYVLAIKITDNGTLEPIYNGPGSIIKQHIIDNNRKAFRNSYYSFTLNVIQKLNAHVKDIEKIKEKKHF